MKLAEALQYRADLQVKVEQLGQRLVQNATYQEEEQPAENPVELLKQLDECIEQLSGIIYQINLTNSMTMTGSGSLTELIAQREVLKQKRSVYQSFAEAASELTPRYGKTEIKILSSYSVPKLQKEIDDLAKRIRLIDNAIQEKNWTTNLVLNEPK